LASSLKWLESFEHSDSLHLEFEQAAGRREKVGGLVEFNADDFRREMDTEGRRGGAG
jgi:hypothetical protein